MTAGTGPPVWLWAAGNKCGISDNEIRAREAAAAACLAGEGPARLEHARLAEQGGRMLGYARSGPGYTGRADGGRVLWTPVPRPAEAA